MNIFTVYMKFFSIEIVSEWNNPIQTTPSDLRRLLEIRMNETSRLSAIIRMIQYGAFLCSISDCNKVYS